MAPDEYWRVVKYRETYRPGDFIINMDDVRETIANCYIGQPHLSSLTVYREYFDQSEVIEKLILEVARLKPLDKKNRLIEGVSFGAIRQIKNNLFTAPNFDKLLIITHELESALNRIEKEL